MTDKPILFEPFRIKSVEPMSFSTPEERKKWIDAVGYNVFALKASQVTIDLLTDSGTGAMSDVQWAEMIQADESYAGSKSFLDLENTVQEITGMPFIIPVHQGRAAEHLLFSEIVAPGHIVPTNSHFDTTLANIEDRGAHGINLLTKEGKDPFLNAPFKGDLDLIALEKLLKEQGDKVPFVMTTITNNTGGGQPVSLANMKAVAELCKQYKKPYICDACRFAENSYFIKKREKGYEKLSPKEISQQTFALFDAMTFSGKKDALANIGGLLCLRDESLVDKLKNRLIVTEGFPTYGGLAGYSLAAMNQGLKEVLDERYLEYRLRTAEWIVEKLVAGGVPVLRPAGGHAIYIESSKFFPHISQSNFPGISLTTELFVQGGVRACELGTVAFGKTLPDGTQESPPLDLVRLALPRRTYTEAHMGFVVNRVLEIFNNREQYRGYTFKEEFPVMRHFRSTFEPLRL